MAHTFERGTFTTFRTLTKIHLGAYGVDVHNGVEFDYDGVVLRYGGAEYMIPQLQKLLGSWYDFAENKESVYTPKRADLQMTPAQPDQEAPDYRVQNVTNHEVVVSEVASQEQRRKEGMANDNLGKAPLPSSVRQPSMPVVSEDGYVQAKTVAEIQAEMAQSSVNNLSSAEADEHNRRAIQAAFMAGQPESLHTEEDAAKADAANKEAIAKALGGAPPKKTTFEVRPDQETRGGYAVTSDEVQGIPVERKYKFSSGASIGSNVLEDGNVQPTDVTKVGRNIPLQVGEAVVDEAPPITATIEAEVENLAGDDLSDVLPEDAVAGKVVKWDTTAHWRTKVKTIKENYANDPAALKVIYAQETPKSVELLKKWLAK